MNENKSVRYLYEEYQNVSGDRPISNHPRCLVKVPGYAEDRRIVVIGDGAKTIEELVQEITPGVQEAQFITTQTDSATAVWTKLFEINLDTVGLMNEIRISVLASGHGGAYQQKELTLRVEQLAAFGNDPVISAIDESVLGELPFTFCYVIDSNDPTVVSVYAMVEQADTRLHGFVLSETFPNTATFYSNGELLTSLTGETYFSSGLSFNLPTAGQKAALVGTSGTPGTDNPYVSKASFNNSLATNGYQYLPNGLIVQWGITGSLAGGASSTITLPVAFPTACAFAVLNQTAYSNQDDATHCVTAKTKTTLSITVGGNVTQPYTWFAIGY